MPFLFYCGAFINYRRPESKHHLMFALADAPSRVLFHRPWPWTTFASGDFVAVQIGPGRKIIVLGPDPDNPKWCCLVTRLPNGRIVCK